MRAAQTYRPPTTNVSLRLPKLREMKKTPVKKDCCAGARRGQTRIGRRQPRRVAITEILRRSCKASVKSGLDGKADSLKCRSKACKTVSGTSARLQFQTNLDIV